MNVNLTHSIVLFYGNNSWAHTRLGRIVDFDADELSEVLNTNESQLDTTGSVLRQGDGSVVVTVNEYQE